MADLQPSEPPINGGLAETLGSKRHRRPSVRLGDIGDQSAAIPYEPYVRRSKQWKFSSSGDDSKLRHFLSKDTSLGISKLQSKTRPLTNLLPEDSHDPLAIPPPPSAAATDENLDPVGVGIRKARRGTGAVMRRVRSSWASKVDEGMEGGDVKSSGEDGGDEFDELRRGESESPGPRVRVSESRDGGPDDAGQGDMPSETDGRDWNNQNGRCRSIEDGGVRSWLNRLGLGRYAPVFEIHEVDDEVLPLLTLEDLKDMGINAIGSRRKMYCAIEKLGKGFT